MELTDVKLGGNPFTLLHHMKRSGTDQVLRGLMAIQFDEQHDLSALRQGRFGPGWHEPIH